MFVLLEGKDAVYNLILNLKTQQPTSHFTPWSLELFIRVSIQLHEEHTVLPPFQRIELIVHIVISVLPGSHLHLSRVMRVRVDSLSK